jgi:hypothetical protein
VDKRGGKSDQPAVPIDGGRLHCCDLMLADALADQVERATCSTCPSITTRTEKLCSCVVRSWRSIRRSTTTSI